MFVHKYKYKRSIQLIKILTNHSLRSIHCNVWFIITSFKLLRHFFLSRDLFLFSAFSMCFFPHVTVPYVLLRFRFRYCGDVEFVTR